MKKELRRKGGVKYRASIVLGTHLQCTWEVQDAELNGALCDCNTPPIVERIVERIQRIAVPEPKFVCRLLFQPHSKLVGQETVHYAHPPFRVPRTQS